MGAICSRCRRGIGYFDDNGDLDCNSNSDLPAQAAVNRPQPAFSLHNIDSLADDKSSTESAIDEDVQDRENGNSPAFQRTSIENENASIGSVVIENDENICSIIKRKSSFSDSNPEASLDAYSQSSMDENDRSNDELKENVVSEEKKSSKGIENEAFTDYMVMMVLKYFSNIFYTDFQYDWLSYIRHYLYSISYFRMYPILSIQVK